jgi:16S rRNA (adenine1518-N6/adenine1519-N6)-dimethyltransferase
MRLFAKKSLGQNFLITTRIVDMIATSADLKEGELAIEIGPGKGVLTKALLAKGARVKAIEKDDRLIPILQEEFKKEITSGQLELIHGDIMEMNIDESVEKIDGGYKIIANIPYYITGALIRIFLSASKKPELMVLMVQKEVATRIVARDEKESLLALSVKVYAKPEIVMNVARGNFFPIPNVDSAVIKLSDIRNPFADKTAEERFFEIIKAGFSQKRKKLSSNLSQVMTKEEIASQFEKLNLDPNIRAEDMKLEQWLAFVS